MDSALSSKSGVDSFVVGGGGGSGWVQLVCVFFHDRVSQCIALSVLKLIL